MQFRPSAVSGCRSSGMTWYPVIRMRLTHIGTATVLMEIGGLRLLTDPALDPAPRHYSFGPGTSSTKTETPALPAAGFGRLDAVLVSHDQHADNLDAPGRALL